jgi:nicotinamide mononucleotide (NMN) deamidase PncC
MKPSFTVLLLLLLLTLPAVVQAQFTFTTNNGAITITGYTGPGGATGAAQWSRGYVNVTVTPKESGRTSKRRSQKRANSCVQAGPFRALLKP